MIPLEWMPPLMLRGLVLFMLVGFPVAFSLSALGVALGFFAIEQGFFHFSFLQAIPSRIFGNVLANELLLAIPFFTFMGAVPEKCGLAEDMLDSMGQLFGPAKGGLGYSLIIGGYAPSQVDPNSIRIEVPAAEVDTEQSGPYGQGSAAEPGKDSPAPPAGEAPK